MDSLALGLSFVFGDPETTMKILLLSLIIVLCIVGVIYASRSYSNATFSNPPNVKNVQAIQLNKLNEEFDKEQAKQKGTLEGAKANLSEMENCLMNFQPLTVIQPGYIGPEVNGVFSVKEGVANAIQIGARCLVLPIDYLTSELAPTFARPNIPCFIYRDDGGVIRSINSGSIKEAANSINELAFSNVIAQKNDPMIIILYFVNTPKPDTKEYVQFLSAVARDLSVLSSRFIVQTNAGIYSRQRKQDELLFEPVQEFQQKTLIFCNIDTSIFRDKQKLTALGLGTFQTFEDLDFMVNLQLFKQSKDTPLGQTSVLDEKKLARGILERVQYFSNLSDDNTNETIRMTKEKWVIALMKHDEVISQEFAKKMLDTYGVQSIPLPLFSSKKEELFSLLSLWKQTWRVKPKDIRYIKPSLIVPNKQNPMVNANGGTLNVSR